MDGSILKNTMTYPSSNEEYTIHAISWQPRIDSDVKAVLQIAHGMAEYADRYDDFARFMVGKGFAVYANDHIGHGYSVNSEGDYGYFGKSMGRTHLVNDMYKLSLIAKDRWLDKPLFLLGHSMGSYLSRRYTALYGNDLSGAVYMGTGNGNPFIGIAVLLAKLMSDIRGDKAPGKLLDRLAFGDFNKHISSPQTNFDWLSTNQNNVEQYINDKLNGFVFTNSAFVELFSVIREVTKKKWATQLPQNLPILLISGKEDPVGNYGKGVEKTMDLLESAGMTNVTLKLYDGMRHEILNEKNNSLVYQYIFEWLEKCIER